MKGMKSGEITIAIFADYSKAFDTIDFDILIHKLHTLNFSKPFLYWILNYLSNREHFVQINTTSSTRLLSTFGVPQGSILGPVIFNLCVADMSTVLKESTCLQYADDTTIYQHCKVKEKEQCRIKIQEEIQKLLNWSTNTNLIFNTAKTKLMLFSTTKMSKLHDLGNNDILQIQCMGNQLERQNAWKVLGMELDENLNWKLHVDKI